jgi:predicted NACHT family NTPase
MITKELTTELLHTISAQRNVCEDMENGLKFDMIEIVFSCSCIRLYCRLIQFHTNMLSL